MPLLEELPWAGRADRFVIIVDGRAYSTPGEREIVLNRARRQIFALRHAEAVAPTARVAVALTKFDELTTNQRDDCSEAEGSLLAEARTIDEHGTAFLIAARPTDGSSAVGMASFMSWLCDEDRPVEGRPRPVQNPALRAIGRFGSWWANERR